MQAILATPEHRVTVYGATGGPERPFYAVCTCGQKWVAREADPRWPTFAEWGVEHQRGPVHPLARWFRPWPQAAIVTPTRGLP